MVSFKRKEKDLEKDEAGTVPAAPSPKRGLRGLRGGKEGGKTKRAPSVGKRGPQFVLMIGDEGGILIFMQGKKVQRRLFAPSPRPDHTATVTELMRNHPKVPLYILADVLDQQYVRQSFPPVSALGVGGLVRRRLDRDFQAEDMKGSLSLGRDKEGRKEWNYLLIALANTPLIQQWLDLVVELPNELRGVYLTPVESQNYIPILKRCMPVQAPASPWQLLVSHNKISGFRQAVLRDGKLVFTRVTQAIDDVVPAVLAGNIEQEIINTLEYLRRLGFQDNNTLEIIVICAQEVKEVLDIKRFSAATANMLTPMEVAEALGLEQAALSADRFGDVVMAACFAQTRRHVLRFQTAYAKQLTQFYTIRRAVFGLAALACLAMGFSAFGDIVGAISDRAEVSSIEKRRQPVLAQLATIKKSISRLDIDVAKKSAIVAAYDAYIKDSKTPLEFVTDFAPLLTPEHKIVSIAWGPKPESGSSNQDQGAIAKANTQIKIEMEFTGAFEDVDALSKAVESYIATLKSKMPNYSIGTGAFPWLSAGAGQGMEISFTKEEGGLREGLNKIEIFFWPKVAPPGAKA